eukprot:183449-Rhodomonas_salina.1
MVLCVWYRRSVWCYALSGTELAYGACADLAHCWRMVLPACSVAKPGTGIAYGAMRSPVLR